MSTTTVDGPHTARNYAPLPVTIARGEGAWVTATDGTKYLDLLAGYSALNFGHRHPTLIEAAQEQLSRITLTSRAFGNDQLPAFTEALGDLCAKDLALPMNTGAEAVETAIKVARAWGYRRKGIAPNQARIIVAHGNFHGRTTTIVSFSDDPVAHDDFGPFTPGFTSVPFGDIDALAAELDDDVAAVLIEPIQGEAGVLIPPTGYLAAVRDLTQSRNCLMIADEIQAGLGRTGTTFACDLESVVPDLYLLGKALGGGVLPVSAVVGNEDVLGVLQPGEHGSTFGGNPLAAAVGSAVIKLLQTGEYQQRARALGAMMRTELDALLGGPVTAVRSVGLWAGVDIDPAQGTGRDIAERLLARRVLVKETHGQTLRIAPPLVISEADLRWGLHELAAVLT